MSSSKKLTCKGTLRQVFIRVYAGFRIHERLVWIRIRGSMPLTNGSGFGSYFVLDLQDAYKKLILEVFLLIYFLKVQLHHFPR
jgi:hypothetical protein